MRRLILGFVVLISTFAAPALAQTTTPPTAAPPVARPDEYVRTFFLTHAVAAEMQQTLAQLVATMPGTRPVITMNRTTNSLTIRGTQSALQTAEEVIKQLDVAPPTTTSAQGQAPAASQPSRLPGLPTLPSTTNIQLELTITDTISGAPSTKTVTMVMLNGTSGMIRTSTPGYDYLLNVDAMATAYQSGQIGVRITFDFTPPTTTVEGKPSTRASRLNESLTVVVTDGKPLVVSQSADAASDRTVTATITAKVLK